MTQESATARRGPGLTSHRPGVPFVKLVAAGNDFVLIDGDENPGPADLSGFAVWACRPGTGIGADGVLLLRRVGADAIRLTAVNPDGSIAKMCGNGVRCGAYYALVTGVAFPLTVELGRHRMTANAAGEWVEVTSPQPDRVRGPVRLEGLDFYTLDTGTAYAVAVVPDVDELDVAELGRRIRYHRHFAPAGTSVSFLDVRPEGLRARTYERGNEAETRSCGSGAVACTVVARHLGLLGDGAFTVHNRSDTPLRVRVEGADGPPFDRLTLAGPVSVVYRGTTVCWP